MMWKEHIVEVVERFVDDRNEETSTEEDDEMAALLSGSMDLM
jgi:hypothetical protein